MEKIGKGRDREPLYSPWLSRTSDKPKVSLSIIPKMSKAALLEAVNVSEFCGTFNVLSDIFFEKMNQIELSTKKQIHCDDKAW